MINSDLTDMTTTNVTMRRGIPNLKQKLAARVTMDEAEREYEKRRAQGLSHDEIERLDCIEWSSNHAQRARAKAFIEDEAAERNRFLWVRFFYTTPEQTAVWEASWAADDALEDAQKNVQRAIWNAERVGITDETEEVRAARAAARTAQHVSEQARDAWVVACLSEEEQAAYRATKAAQATAQQCPYCKRFFSSSQDCDGGDIEAHRIRKRGRQQHWDNCLLPQELLERGWRLIDGVWHAK